ncbi:MAG: sugar transferase [Candidatus Marsarchaeota archaeon]|nr:sugar transferase [Candidatus Marsarchaeota archaeon]
MLKRTFDVLFSALFLVVLSSLFLVIGVITKLDSKGPLFHRATRVGKDGKLFILYKFRTMVVDATGLGPGITCRGDPRITRVGRILRKTKIDELPQLINVLKGEMSIIGPRPEDPRYVAHYSATQRQVLRVRPGLAGPAAVKYRHEEELLAAAGDNWESIYLTVVLPDKLRMDLEYVERQSLLFDLLVLTKVVVSLFSLSNRPTNGCPLPAYGRRRGDPPSSKEVVS